MSQHEQKSLRETPAGQPIRERRETMSWRRMLAEGALLLALLLTSSWLIRG
jgi:hypothetical protein